MTYLEMIQAVRAERIKMLEDRIELEKIAWDSNSEKVIEFCKERLSVLKSLD